MTWSNKKSLKSTVFFVYIKIGKNVMKVVLIFCLNSIKKTNIAFIKIYFYSVLIINKVCLLFSVLVTSVQQNLEQTGWAEHSWQVWVQGMEQQNWGVLWKEQWRSAQNSCTLAIQEILQSGPVAANGVAPGLCSYQRKQYKPAQHFCMLSHLTVLKQWKNLFKYRRGEGMEVEH